MELLRLITAGNVDDGKSTLIGRLLYDRHALLDDQLSAIKKASQKQGFDELNLALVTDGLRAEREQGITIDVAYRYFNTEKRKFIIADCPGHFEYTRNMVTGASTANVAVILVDARKGIAEQTRRHCFVASLMRIPHLILCVNKMDLVGFSEETFEQIRSQFLNFSERLDISDISFIPVSALHGENVVHRSDKMPWYEGGSLLQHLDELQFADDTNLVDFRFPIQSVLWSPQITERRYTGRLTSGLLRIGDEVMILPSGMATKVKAIEFGGREIPEAQAMMSVSLILEDEIDISRGDMLVSPENRPKSTEEIEALICWMDETQLLPRKQYVLRHTSSEAKVFVKSINYKVDINSIDRIEGSVSVALNDFAHVSLRMNKPLHAEPYQENRATGSFVLIDETTGSTLAAGMIL